MTALAETSHNFIELYQEFEKSHTDGAWFAPVRQSAMARFTELGFPTTSDEDWRFTSVAPVARTVFRRPSECDAGTDLQKYLLDGACTLVFVNGRYCPELSSRSAPASVRTASLAAAMRAGTDAVRRHLAKYARHQTQAFAALNTAFVEDGAVIELAAGAVVEQPIHLVFASTGGAEPVAIHPRVLVLAGANSQAHLVESYVSVGSGVYLTNAVTELVAAEGAVIDHCRVQREAPDAFHVGTTQLYQQRSSTVSSLNVSIGGALVRNDITATLDGEGCDCTLNGLFMGADAQHIDNHLRVEHAKPHCHSWEYYKGILDDKAHGVFTGRIVVFKDAQKTDAKQTNMNLLLSEQAQIDTKPQLEIFADDVKCTHGATIGQIDADALFYLRARGLREEVARSMLIHAFAGESLGQIKVEPLRRQLENVLFERLPGGQRLREAI